MKTITTGMLLLLAAGCADDDLAARDDELKAQRFVVDDDGADCPGAGYTTIQAAVNAAPAGATVTVCAGMYVENVRVTKLLKLHGARAGIDGRDRTLDSPGESVVASNRPFVIGGADGSVLDGFTVRVVLGDDGEGSGILMSNFNSGYRIVNNVIDADGVTGLFAGASGASQSLARTNHFYNRLGIATSGDEPSAIAHGWLFAENLFTDSDLALFSRQDSDVVMRRNRFEGGGKIWVDGASAVRVTDNDIVGSELSGLFIEASTDVTVRDNVISGSAEAGIRVRPNASGNTLRGNQVSGSGTFDCQDESIGSGTLGTANTWRRNRGATSSPAGLCTP